MALYTFVIYAKTDFSQINFQGSITTNATLNPIYITIEDNDAWLGGSAGTTFEDTNGQQTIVSSSDPSLVGLPIELNLAFPSYNYTLAITTGTNIRISDLSIDGSNGYVIAQIDGVNAELAPSTTYTEDDGTRATLGINYANSALPCFLAGTLIATPEATVPIEALSIGDRVCTADGTVRRIRWIGSRRIAPPELAQNPKLRPIRIAAGAMGGGLPERDLLVSRQHRLLVTAPVAERLFGAPEVLVPAIRLVGLPGIDVDEPQDEITYLHILCDTHEVLLAEGCPAESLYIGPMMQEAAECPDFSFLPDVPRDRDPMRPARILADGRRARQLQSRLTKNGKTPLHGLWQATERATRKSVSAARAARSDGPDSGSNPELLRLLAAHVAGATRH